MGVESLRVAPVRTPSELEQARWLMRAYVAAIGAELGLDLAYQGIDEELGALPGKYAPPTGVILLGWVGGVAEPTGVVALRPLELGTAGERLACEMKRLYVAPEARGSGLGRRLIEALLSEGAAMGYRTMKLDTDTRLHAARRLYERTGFRPCPRFNDDPHPETIYFERPLVG